MKILNIILCVLILLLALASAAASYLLFEKRVQLVSGWGKMASAINQTAVKLEKGSGLNVSAELTTETLGHGKYKSKEELKELDAKLDKLTKLAEQLVTQRNNLVADMLSVGRIADMQAGPSVEQLQAFASSKAGAQQIVSGVDRLRKNRNELANSIIRSAKTVNVPLTKDELTKGNAGIAFSKFNTRVNAIQNEFKMYRDTLEKISYLAGGDSLKITDQNYAQAIAQVTNAVTQLRNKYNTALSNVSAEQRKRLQTEHTVKQRDGQINTLRLSINSKNDEIVQYRRALGMDTRGFQAWKSGSPECRRAVRGKVVAVNEKFGYIGIDLGSDSRVRQPLGGKSVEVNPDIASGMTMYVVRGAGEIDKVTYIAKVKLTTVDTDTSIAESIEVAPDQKIKVGDMVFMEDGFAAVDKPAAAK